LGEAIESGTEYTRPARVIKNEEFDKMRAIEGFTLVEMVVIILLLGIVGAVVFSRVLTPSAFNVRAATDALASTAQAAQQLALGRSDVTLTIESSGGNWLISTNAGGTAVRSASVPAAGVVLETGSTAFSA